MNDILNKINRVNPDQFTNIDKNFNLLVEIHYYLFNSTKVRCCDGSVEIITELIDSLFKESYRLDTYEHPKEICETMALIKLYQPFSDGNHTTILYLLKLILLINNADLKNPVTVCNLNYYKKLIPLVYSSTDKISPKKIKLFKNNIITY